MNTVMSPFNTPFNTFGVGGFGQNFGGFGPNFNGIGAGLAGFGQGLGGLNSPLGWSSPINTPFGIGGFGSNFGGFGAGLGGFGGSPFGLNNPLFNGATTPGFGWNNPFNAVGAGFFNTPFNTPFSTPLGIGASTPFNTPLGIGVNTPFNTSPINPALNPWSAPMGLLGVNPIGAGGWNTPFMGWNNPFIGWNTPFVGGSIPTNAENNGKSQSVPFGFATGFPFGFNPFVATANTNGQATCKAA